jgi:hypothetical protein
MRTTQTNTTEKTTELYKLSVSNTNTQSSANVVLTLTAFDRNGGET